MSSPEPSRTAMAVAMMRALHARTDPAPLLADRWADRLLPDTVRDGFRDAMLARMEPQARLAAVGSPATILDEGLRTNPMYADIIIRARYTEDALALAYARGVRQYVIVGAGFDSFALRIPEAMADLSVIEVDHPGTQGYKRLRLEACGIEPPAALSFVGADLSLEGLATALRRSPFRRRAPAFFAWLGVTMYLTREANLAALRNIASIASPGSELVFTYLDERLFATDSGHASMRELLARVARLNEPWLSGFDPATLGSVLHAVGHELIEDLDGSHMVQRYDSQGRHGLSQDSCAHVARTRVLA